MVWWIASWAKDEQLQGKNNLLREGALVLGECGGFDGMDLVQDEMLLDEMRFDQIRCSLIRCPSLRWWLVLYIEARVLFPNIRRERDPTTANFKGDN